MSEPDDTWVQDQHDAAAEELKPLRDEFLAAHAVGVSFIAPDADEAILIRDAIQRRVSLTCVHYRTLTPPPLIVMLSERIGMCLSCISVLGEDGLRYLAAEDDGRCDLCDAPSTHFVPFGTQYGPAWVGGHVCDVCAQRLGLSE